MNFINQDFRIVPASNRNTAQKMKILYETEIEAHIHAICIGIGAHANIIY